MQRLKALEDENRRLKQIVAEQRSTSKRSRRSSQTKVSTTARREAVGWLREMRGLRLRRACRLVGLSTATWRYERRLSAANAKLMEQLYTHAAARSRFGYCRLHVLIAREGTVVNHKRLYRLYRSAGLQVRRRRRKRLTRGQRVPLPAPRAPRATNGGVRSARASHSIDFA